MNTTDNVIGRINNAPFINKERVAVESLLVGVFLELIVTEEFGTEPVKFLFDFIPPAVTSLKLFQLFKKFRYNGGTIRTVVSTHEEGVDQNTVVITIWAFP